MPVYKINGKNILFIHIPKTGGSSVEFFLRENAIESFYNPSIPDFLKCSPQHLTLSDYKLLLGNLEFEFMFTIIRDPYDRILSEYFYRTQLTMDKYYKRPDFTDWLRTNFNKAKKNKFHLDNHFRKQCEFLDRKLTIYRFENNLDTILEKICNSIGLEKPQDIPKLNQSKRDDYKMDSQDIRLINNFYLEDFELLGYEMRKPQF